MTNWTGSAAGPGLGARVPWKAGRVNTSLALFAEVSCAIVKLSQISSRACLGGEGGGGRKFLEEVEALGKWIKLQPASEVCKGMLRSGLKHSRQLGSTSPVVGKAGEAQRWPAQLLSLGVSSNKRE